MIEGSMVFHAYRRFQKYKGLFGGFSFKSRDEILDRRRHLMKQRPEHAFTEMEIELGLAYDLFYTKIWLIFEDKLGWVLHLVSLISEVATLVLWILVDKQHVYHGVDVRLTNTLLIGGVAVDAVSILRLAFSDLSSYHLMKLFSKCPAVLYILNQMLLIKSHEFWGRRLFMFRRWSRSVSQFNLAKYAKLHKTHGKTWEALEEKCRGIFGIDRDVSTTMISEDMLWNIFDKVKSRVQLSGGKAESREALRSFQFGEYLSSMFQQEKLMKLLTAVGIVDGMLLWHITTILFYKDSKNRSKCEQTAKLDKENKQISDYLMYLLLRQPKMVLEGVVTDMTVEDMIQYLERSKDIAPGDTASSSPPPAPGTNAVLKIDGALVREYVSCRKKRDAGLMLDSVHRLSRSIVAQLNAWRWGEEEEATSAKVLINEVWTDYLLYAAIHCRAYRHVKRLGEGGELLTLVWLFMSHVGLNIKFEDTDFEDTEFEDTDSDCSVV